MNNKKESPVNGSPANGNSTKGKKGVSVGLVICFVAVIAMVGTYTFRHYQSEVKNELAKAELQTDEQARAQEDSASANTTDILPETKTNDAAKEEKETEKTEQQEDSAPAEESGTQTQNTSAPAAEVFFADTDELIWPVDGSIMMNYSMDQTVYFATLDQYKYNPAVLISGDVGTQVTAAARGIVKSVEESPQTGLTMTVDIGNGYEIVYGQLKDLQFHEGSLMEAGELIGYLQQPSRYYVVEGSNLYFEVLKDGVPVNPLDYLEA